MQQREDEARKSGRLGVFLNPREVGVVVAALTWARTDLAFAKRLLAERAPDHVRAEVPEELFTNWPNFSSRPIRCWCCTPSPTARRGRTTKPKSR